MAWAAAAAPVVGGIIGNLASAGDRRAARDRASEALGELMSVGMPPDLSARLVLQQFQQQGELTPELEQAIQQQSSQMANVQADQGAVDAQKKALELISQRARVGLTPEDRAQLAQIQRQTAQDAEAKRQQIIQNLQARGQGGSGAELAAQLAASQNSAQQANQNALQVGGQASQNALNAIAGMGNLGGQIRQQSFGEGSARAQAQDVLNQFNTQNQRDIQMRNVGSKNQAQAANLGTKQQISNANVQQANAETQRQNEAKRQYWLDQMTRAGMRSGALMGASQQAQNQAQGTAGMWSGIGQGVGSGIGAINQSNQNADWLQAYKDKQG